MNARRVGDIVIGVDETALGGEAVRWGAEQARLEGRSVLLVNTTPPISSAWADRATGVPSGTFANLRQRGEGLLARAREQVARTAPDVTVDEVFDVTDPATLLTALTGTAHLVVLGSRGRGPTLSQLLGSVSRDVVRHSRCPVVVHRPGSTDGTRRGVLVAVEAEPQARAVLEAAYQMASLRRLPLRVVHYVFDARSVLVGTAMVGDVAEQEQTEAMVVAEALAGLQEQYPDVPVRVETLHGLPEHALARESAEADLLVLGSHQRGLLGRFLAGSVSETVLGTAHCPVLVVPPPGA